MPTLSHKIQLLPTDAQVRSFARAAGTARFAYNWGLGQWKAMYEAHKVDATQPSPSGRTLRKRWNAIRAEQFPWSYEVPATASNDAFVHLQRAFDAFFGKRGRYPRFKRKGEHAAFTVDGRAVSLDGRVVVLPRFGKLRLAEPLRFEGKLGQEATISREADRWYLAVSVEMPTYTRVRTGDGVVGVDLGLTHLATLSTGEKIENPRALQHALRRLARAQRAHARKVKGSTNRRKSALRLARIHRRVANTRKHAIHTLTSRLCRENQAVGIEGLRPKNMVKNRRLARSISDAAFGEFRRQMAYKAPLYGTRLGVAGPFEPSTRRCSRCQQVGPALPLSQRVFVCPCGHTQDRDVNAAVNLRTLMVGGTLAGNSQDACGEGVSLTRHAAAAVLGEAGSRARPSRVNS